MPRQQPAAGARPAAAGRAAPSQQPRRRQQQPQPQQPQQQPCSAEDMQEDGSPVNAYMAQTLARRRANQHILESCGVSEAAAGGLSRPRCLTQFGHTNMPML